MACGIQNITDPKLQQLIDANGSKDGLDKYLKEYGDLIRQFEPKDKLSNDKLIDLKHKLDIHNAENQTNHELYINDGKNEFKYGVNPLKDIDHSVRLKIDWGSTVTKPEDKLVDQRLFSNGLEGTPLDGNISPEEKAKLLSDISYDPNNDPELMAKLAKEINGTPINDEYLGDEDLMAAYQSDQDRERRRVLEQTNGGSGEVGSGISEVLGRISGNIEDIKKSKYQLLNNRDRIDKEIKILRKSGLPDSDEKIQNNLSRLRVINEKIAERTSMYNKLSKDLIATRITKTIENLRNLFDDHKKFALKIANSENADAGDINKALDAMKTWGKIRELSLATLDKIDPEVYKSLGVIESDANSYPIRELRQKSLIMQEKLAKDLGLSVDRTDFEHSSDINFPTRMFISLAGTKSKPLALLHNILKKMNILSSIDFSATTKRLGEIEKDIKTAGLNWSDFLDDSAKVISRISPKFYEDRAAMNEKYETAINDAKNESLGTYNDVRLGAAIRARNTWLKGNTYIINPEEIVTVEGRKRVKDKLIAMSGDERYAEDKIVDAQMKYEHFQRDKAEFEKYIREEYASSLPTEKILSKEDLDRKIANFTKYNSPVEYKKYIESSLGKVDMRPNNEFERYSTEVPVDIHNISGHDTGYYSDDYKNKILNDPIRISILNKHNDYVNEMISYLPSYLTDKMDESFWANQRQGFWERFNKQGIMAFFNFDKSKLIQDIAVRPGQNEMYGSIDSGNKVRRSIPVRMINELSPSQKSTNYGRVMRELTKMAIDYKHISNTEDKVLLLRKVLDDIKTSYDTPDGAKMKETNGNIKTSEDKIFQTLAMADHAITNNLYGMRFNPELITSHKMFDDNKVGIKVLKDSPKMEEILQYYTSLVDKKGVDYAVAQTNKKYPAETSVAKERLAYKDFELHLDDLHMKYEDGNISEEDYNRQLELLDRTRNTIGANVAGSKLAGWMLKFSFLKTFAFQPLTGFARDVYGTFTLCNWAAAGRYRIGNTSDVLRADVDARKAINKSLSKNSITNNKWYNLALIGGIFKSADVMESYSDPTRINSDLLRASGIMHAATDKNRIAIMIARFRQEKITDLKGNIRELGDAFNNDGSWNTAEFGKNDYWNGDVNNPEHNKKRLSFYTEVARLNELIHGNMDTDTSPESTRYLSGRIIGQFRTSWMSTGIQSRFGPKMFDEVLQKNIEGRYKTTYKFIKANGIAKGVSTILKLMAFQGDKAFSNNLRMSPKDKEMIMGNVKQTVNEMYQYLAMGGAYMALSAAMANDDKDKSAKYFMLNMIHRTMNDMSFYFEPQTFTKISSNLVPLTSLYDDFSKLTTSITKHMEGDAHYDQQSVMENVARQFPIINMWPKFDIRQQRLLDQSGSYH